MAPFLNPHKMDDADDQPGIDTAAETAELTGEIPRTEEPEPVDTFGETREGIADTLATPGTEGTEKKYPDPNKVKRELTVIRGLIRGHRFNDAERMAESLLAYLTSVERNAHTASDIATLKRQMWKIESRREKGGNGKVAEATHEKYLVFFRGLLENPETDGWEADEAAYSLMAICMEAGRQAEGVSILLKFLQSGEKNPETAIKAMGFVTRMCLQRATSLREAVGMKKDLSAEELVAWVQRSVNRHHSKERIELLEELLARPASGLEGINVELSIKTLAIAYENAEGLKAALGAIEKLLLRLSSETGGPNIKIFTCAARMVEDLKAKLRDSGLQISRDAERATPAMEPRRTQEEGSLLGKCISARNKGDYATALSLANDLLALQLTLKRKPNVTQKTEDLIRHLKELISTRHAAQPAAPETTEDFQPAVMVRLPESDRPVLAAEHETPAPEETPAETPVDTPVGTPVDPAPETQENTVAEHLTQRDLQEELISWVSGIQALAKKGKWEIEVVVVQKKGKKPGEIKYLTIPEGQRDRLAAQFEAIMTKYGDELIDLLCTDTGDSNLRGMLTNLHGQLREGRLKTKGRTLDDILRVLGAEG